VAAKILTSLIFLLMHDQIMTDLFPSFDYSTLTVEDN